MIIKTAGENMKDGVAGRHDSDAWLEMAPIRENGPLGRSRDTQIRRQVCPSEMYEGLMDAREGIFFGQAV